jgi:hypothetical protein
MIAWILMFSLHLGGEAVSLQQFGPFQTEAACKAAGQRFDKALHYSKDWICAPTGDVPPKQ